METKMKYDSRSDGELHQRLVTEINFDYSYWHDVIVKAQGVLTFAHVSQWNHLDDLVATPYRGEFDICKKERRRVAKSIKENSFNAKFKTLTKEDEDLATVMNGYYRNCFNNNQSKLAVETALGNAIDCGFGAWVIDVEHSNKNDDFDNSLKPTRKQVDEAVCAVIWDRNSRVIDRSDAKRCTVVKSYSKEAYDKLMKKYGFTGSEADFYPNSVDYPYGLTNFKWGGVDDSRHVGEVYEEEVKKVKKILFVNQVDKIAIEESKLEEMQSMLDAGMYQKVGSKRVEVKEIYKTVLSGSHVLERKKIYGKFIPVIPLYGEVAVVDGQTFIDGIYDNLMSIQEMRNTVASYAFDLLSTSPKPKDIWSEEQIAGYEHMYNEQNESTYPYYLQNLKDEQGNELPAGALGYRGGAEISQGVQYLLQFASQAAIEQTGGSISTEQMLNPQVTSDQLDRVKSLMDDQTILYQEHLEFAYAREGEVFASIVADIKDGYEVISITSHDGKESTTEINKPEFDAATMTVINRNPLHEAAFACSVSVGKSYDSLNQQAYDQLGSILAEGQIADPDMVETISLQRLAMLKGTEYELISSKARKKLVLRGDIEEEDMTEEELMMMQQMQQQQPQPNAQEILAMAEAQAREMEGQAAVMDKENDRMKIMADMSNDENQNIINQEKVMNDRIKLDIEAQKAGADINLKDAQAVKTMKETFASNDDYGYLINL